MAKYYGGKLKNVTLYNVPFDYGAIVNNEGYVNVNKVVGSGITLKRVLFYSEPGTLFFRKNKFALLETNISPKKLFSDGRHVVFLNITYSNGDVVNADIGNSYAVKVGNDFYYAMPLPSGASVDNIKDIELGMPQLQLRSEAR
ncbi:MAG: hypothetical protein ACRC6F_10390 [Aeromonas sp.]